MDGEEDLDWTELTVTIAPQSSLDPSAKYRSFAGLVRNAGLLKAAHSHMRYVHKIETMHHFTRPSTLTALRDDVECEIISQELYNNVASVWNAARASQTNANRNRTRQKEKEVNDVNVNADRNEMVALLQGAKGAKFVKVGSVGGKTLTFKALDLELKNDDIVVVQTRNGLALGIVVEVNDEVPTSSDYDFSHQLRHVVAKVDTDRSKALIDLDERILRMITNSEAQDRLERLTRQLGTALENIDMTLTLGPADDAKA